MPVQKKETIRVQGGVQVNRPSSQVFSFLKDVDRFPEWQHTNFEIQEKKGLRSGALEAHGHVKDRRNVLGKEIESEYEVTDLQEGRSISLEVKEGPVYWQMTYTVADVGGGTYVTASGGGDLGQLKTDVGVAAKACQRMLETDLHTLRDILEAAA
jgi:hypothetical protein